MIKKSMLLNLSIAFNVAFVTAAGYRLYRNRPVPFDTSHIEYQYNRQELHQVLNIEPSDIVFIGDSHIQKFELFEFFKDTRVRNRGIGGDVTAGVYSRIRESIKGHPNKIFLAVGINDIDRGIPTDTSLAYYNRILDKIKLESPTTLTYVQSILPSSTVPADSVIRLNEGLEALCKKHGVKFIDLFPKFNDNGKLKKELDCGDNLHLSGKGYILMSALISPYLN